MSFFSDLVNTVVRGGLAYFTGGLSEVAFRGMESVSGNPNKAGQIGGAIGGVIGNTWGDGENVTGTDGPITTESGSQAVDQATQEMAKPTLSQQMNTPPVNTQPTQKGTFGKVVGWMEKNPEITKMVGSGIANMFTPDEIDIMRERARLASRNYDGSGLVDLPGQSGSFGQRADQARGQPKSGVSGGYADSSRSADSIDPFVGAGERPSVFDGMQKQAYSTGPQEYYDSLRKNRGIIGRVRGQV